FNEREAGRKVFLNPERVAWFGVASQRAGGRIIRRRIGLMATTGVFGFSFRQPIKTGVRRDANARLAVFRTGALEKNFRRSSTHPPDLGRRWLVALRTTGNRALEK